MSTFPSSQATPALARVLQTLQMSLLGGSSSTSSRPKRHPFLAQVLQTLQMSLLGGTRARQLAPRTPVLVRGTSTNTPNVHSKRHKSTYRNHSRSHSFFSRRSFRAVRVVFSSFFASRRSRRCPDFFDAASRRRPRPSPAPTARRVAARALASSFSRRARSLGIVESRVAE